MRRRKNQKPNENEEEDLQEALRESNRTTSLTLRNYASLQDLSGLQQIHHNEGVPFSKHSSTTSLTNQGQQQGPKGSTLTRQNSEPLGVQI